MQETIFGFTPDELTSIAHVILTVVLAAVARAVGVPFVSILKSKSDQHSAHLNALLSGNQFREVEEAARKVHSAVNTGLDAALNDLGISRVPAGKMRELVLDRAVEHVLGDGAKDSAARLSLSREGIKTVAKSALAKRGFPPHASSSINKQL